MAWTGLVHCIVLAQNAVEVASIEISSSGRGGQVGGDSRTCVNGLGLPFGVADVCIGEVELPGDGRVAEGEGRHL